MNLCVILAQGGCHSNFSVCASEAGTKFATFLV